jgi:hypothetical protein
MSVLQPAGQTIGRTTVSVAPGVWIRNQRRTRAWAAIAVVWSVAFAAIPFIQNDVVVGLIYLGIAGLGIAFARRIARAGVSIEPDRILVRGPFTSHVVPIADVDAFVPGLQGGWGNGTPCPMLTRTHGRPVGVWALGQRNVVFRYGRLFGEIRPLCDQLNALVTRPQSSSPGRSTDSQVL